MLSPNDAASAAVAVTADSTATRERTRSRDEVVHAAPVGTSTAVRECDNGRFVGTTAHAEQSLGEMLRTARLARGWTTFALAAEWLDFYVASKPGLIMSPGSRRLRIETMEATLDAMERDFIAPGECRIYLPELCAAMQMTSQESDVLMTRAGIVPPDLAALILANPSKLDAVRFLLDAVRCPVCNGTTGVHGIPCVECAKPTPPDFLCKCSHRRADHVAVHGGVECVGCDGSFPCVEFDPSEVA